MSAIEEKSVETRPSLSGTDAREILERVRTATLVSGSFPERELDRQEGLPRHEPLLTNFSDLHGKVALYGGTFDPVHVGHLGLANTLLAREQVDYVVFLVNPKTPGKDPVSVLHRIEMLRLELDSIPGAFVSTFEYMQHGLKRSGKAPNSLRGIREELPQGSELYFTLGSDVLPFVPSWDDFQDLIQAAKLLVVERSGFPLEEKIESIQTTFSSEVVDQIRADALPQPDIPELSSSFIKEGIQQGLKISSLGISETVERYARLYGLWGLTRE